VAQHLHGDTVRGRWWRLVLGLVFAVGWTARLVTREAGVDVPGVVFSAAWVLVALYGAYGFVLKRRDDREPTATQ
jgi:hypothetical protein